MRLSTFPPHRFALAGEARASHTHTELRNACGWLLLGACGVVQRVTRVTHPGARMHSAVTSMCVCAVCNGRERLRQSRERKRDGSPMRHIADAYRERKTLELIRVESNGGCRS